MRTCLRVHFHSKHSSLSLFSSSLTQFDLLSILSVSTRLTGITFFNKNYTFHFKVYRGKNEEEVFLHYSNEFRMQQPRAENWKKKIKNSFGWGKCLGEGRQVRYLLAQERNFHAPMGSSTHTHTHSREREKYHRYLLYTHIGPAPSLSLRKKSPPSCIVLPWPSLSHLFASSCPTRTPCIVCQSVITCWKFFFVFLYCVTDRKTFCIVCGDLTRPLSVKCPS